MPLIAEPLRARTGASVQFAPAMNVDDFRRALEQLGAAAGQAA